MNRVQTNIKNSPESVGGAIGNCTGAFLLTYVLSFLLLLLLLLLYLFIKNVNFYILFQSLNNQNSSNYLRILMTMIRLLWIIIATSCFIICWTWIFHIGWLLQFILSWLLRLMASRLLLLLLLLLWLCGSLGIVRYFVCPLLGVM